jgi:deoxyadenosine/deoxycytidine kinase
MALSNKYIVVEGLIGVGKTTLSELLAKKYQARLILEQFEENPFLEKFYAQPERYAFQTELSFLASRYKQQETITAPELFSRVTIADYIFEKNRIFAGLTLTGDELALYDRIYRIMLEQAAKPDLIIYLQAPIEQVQANIRNRGRSYEQNISADYLKDLATAYKNYLGTYKNGPVAIINCAGIDFLQNNDHFNQIEEIVMNQSFRGVQHFELDK